MEKKYYCPRCWHLFEKEEITFNENEGKLEGKCPKCGWHGTDITDESEKDTKVWEGGYNKKRLEKAGYGIVTWPDSQYLVETEGYAKHSWLINDSYGLNRFGSCAYVVEIEWYQDNV